MTPFTNLNFPTRIFECLSLEKPVIVPRTRGIGDYFDEGSIYFFDADDANDLADKIIKVYSNASERMNIVRRGVKVYKEYRWELQQKKLVNLVAGLLERPSYLRSHVRNS